MAAIINTGTIDILAVINGYKPKIHLQDGETMQSTSSTLDRNYLIKRIWNHYDCNCTSWRFDSKTPITARSCRHLKYLLGEKYEAERIKLQPSPPPSTTQKPLKSTRKKAVAVVVVAARKPTGVESRKRKSEDEGDDCEEEEEEGDGDEEKGCVPPPLKRKRVVVVVGKNTVSSSEEEEEEEDDDDNEYQDNNNEEEEEDEEEAEEDEEEEEEAVKQPTTSTRRTSTRQKTVVKKPKDTSFKPLLAHKWDLEKGKDPIGWHMSEKLDGVRAYWNGKTLLSREGNPFYAPEWFTKRLPKNITLDGELFTTRGGFQKTVSIVRTQNNPSAWKFAVSFQIFDCPSMATSPFETRLSFLQSYFSGKGAIKWVSVLPHQLCKSRAHLINYLDSITAQKGEGVMLREPGSVYVQGRSKSLLKVKRFFDADAIVRGHEKGSGKNADVCGAMRVEMLDADTGEPTGKEFKIGSGLTDAQRKNPPKIGAVVIYRFQELSNSGTPRFPTFVGERAD